jgi:hypothetical protein
MSPVLADFVAKRFCLLERARLIQDQAPMRNVDSKIHAARFDRFKFYFTGSPRRLLQHNRHISDLERRAVLRLLSEA